ncbi:hypothetical protein DRN84_02035 [Candidatus Geothermarchaeota archaeon]|nr:MAG: hypothetical protein DRN84_02035 [Candidatus Geothermarchaeota archaeon]HEW93842.1 hypothetical protein [Thermoprotei archaeon]
MESRDIVLRLIGILLVVIMILLILKIDVSILTRFIGVLYPLDKIIDAETLYLWRERLFDTILQAIAILVGLMGVFVLVIWGERHGRI